MITRLVSGSRSVSGILLVALMAAAPTASLAHPHVWVTSRTEVLYDDSQRLTGLRHVWTFDEAYSAYVVQGLDVNEDGILTPDELQELAELNATSLVDFGYFTEVKVDGTLQEFGTPSDYSMAYEDKRTTLTFTLPLAEPARAAKVLVLDVYDPEYFVSFRMDDGEDAVRLAGGPSGCATSITRPATVDIAEVQNLSEAFFEALTASSNFSEQFANRALIACP